MRNPYVIGLRKCTRIICASFNLLAYVDYLYKKKTNALKHSLSIASINKQFISILLNGPMVGTRYMIQTTAYELMVIKHESGMMAFTAHYAIPFRSIPTPIDRWSPTQIVGHFYSEFPHSRFICNAHLWPSGHMEAWFLVFV